MSRQNLGEGSEAMDMVLDNLGMDDTLDNLGDESGIEDGDEGSDSIDEGEDLLDRTGHEPEVRRDRQQRQQPQRQQQQPQQRPIPKTAEIRADQRGNLIGPDGKVVAKAGFEARMYQDTVRARGEAAQATAQVRDVTSRLNRAVEIGQQFHGQIEGLKQQLADKSGAGDRLGLTQSEQLQAFQFAAEAKQDPIAAIRKLLTLAASRGVDVTKIGMQPGGVDPKSLVDLVRNEITTAMNPLKAETEARQRAAQETEQQTQQYQATEREVQGFFNENPAAREHIPVFHAVLSDPKFSKMSLGEVWARIQLNLERNAMRGNGQQRVNPQQRRNLPAGRGAPNGGTSEMAPINASYDQILRDTLDQLGIDK